MKSTWLKFNETLSLSIERTEDGAVDMKIIQANSRGLPATVVAHVIEPNAAEEISKLLLGDRAMGAPKYSDDIKGPFHLLPVLGMGDRKLALHDSSGRVIPCQTDVKYDGPISDVSTITVKFIVDGRFIRLGAK